MVVRTSGARLVSWGLLGRTGIALPNGDTPDAEGSNVCSVLREIPDLKVVSVAIDRVNAGARHC